MTIEDHIIEKYSQELQRIYDNHTAGDHTFMSLLSKMVMELEKRRVTEEKKKFDELYEKALDAMKQAGPPLTFDDGVALLEEQMPSIKPIKKNRR